MDFIEIEGARTHNLKNLHLRLPRNQLIVITGLSGSGKSSLAFDTLYAEGQRRYVESLSAYARQFLSLMEKPDVDHIEGLSPAIAIEQKSTSHNPRSTVGTITEIHDYLRLLFARIGTPKCPQHDRFLTAQTVSQMVDQIFTLSPDDRFMLLAPIVKARKGEHQKLLQQLAEEGYLRARIDGTLYPLADPPKLLLQQKHTIEVVVDRFRVREELKQRIADSIETTLALAKGIALVVNMDREEAPSLLFSAHFACPHCGYSIDTLTPRMFSFNNPAGACQTCDGLGVQQFFDPEKIVAHPELSLSGGAILGWEKRQGYYYTQLTAVAAHYNLSLDQPFSQIPAEFQHILLYGSQQESIAFTQFLENEIAPPKHRPFEGIIPIIERRYRETESMAIRTALNKYLNQRLCTSCQGSRLKEGVRHVYLNTTTLPTITEWSIEKTLAFFSNLKLTKGQLTIAEKILQEIQQRLKFLIDVGLDYLSLGRAAETLSGGEAQRIRLASQIGAGLVGVMYVLDEPSIGLHQRDNARLLTTLRKLQQLGNTVIVVEHDEEAIRAADHLIDMGPGAGVHGGNIVAQGTVNEVIANPASPTGAFLSGRRVITIPEKRKLRDPSKQLHIIGARGNNLQTLSVALPIGLLTCITGVSGSGKSTLIHDTLLPVAQRILNRSEVKSTAPYERIEGFEHLDKVINIDQNPIGRTPRSNPATYTGSFTIIRELFAGTPEARIRGYTAGRFSFNVRGGRCEACEGEGLINVEMHFLPDIYVTCEQCKGSRYNRETLEIRYKNKNIAEILHLTIEEAVIFFEAIPNVSKKLATLVEVGLNYLTLGQSATSLSGGEAQRVKLAKELARRDTGNTLYLLDEPTTGLHFADIQLLLKVLHQLRDHGNTIVIIEHNLEVIKTADWVIDLGPEGGARGGELVAEGTPDQLTQHPLSHTGHFLAPLLQRSR